MAAKEIIFDNEAKKKILNGIDTLANAVRGPLGPRGRNVVIEKPGEHRLSPRMVLRSQKKSN